MLEKIKKKVVVESINLTADDWDLYSSMEGSNLAANTLNKMVMIYANKYPLDKDKADEEITKVMEELKNYGAIDSEPRYVMRKILNFIYGE